MKFDNSVLRSMALLKVAVSTLVFKATAVAWDRGITAVTVGATGVADVSAPPRIGAGVPPPQAASKTVKARAPMRANRSSKVEKMFIVASCGFVGARTVAGK